MVRERLYRDAVERAIGAAGKVRWIPPPIGGGSYRGQLRITIQPVDAGAVQPPAAGQAPQQPPAPAPDGQGEGEGEGDQGDGE